MKKSIIILFFLMPVLVFCQGTSQSSAKKPNKIKTVEAEKNADVYKVVGQMPEFPGGKDAMFQYLVDNMKFPDAARTKKIEGLVVVNFIVDEEGKLSNIKVIKSVSPELDREAMRMVKAMPQWKPGKHQGKEVKVNMNLPVKFKL